MIQREEIFRRLSLGDSAFLDALIRRREAEPDTAELSAAAEALVKLGALAVTDGSGVTWQRTVGKALDTGVTPDEIADALVVLAPLIGAARVFSIVPKVALAVGCDVDAMLEQPVRRPSASAR